MKPSSVIAVILGGGRGTRLHPLTKDRSKPAVPIAGKYRLVDIPISNCLNSDIRRIFVLTQFNSASLNRHIKNTYNFDVFSNGFVDILAAEQTPKSQNWYQGTADAVRQSLHHMEAFSHEYVMILSGDQLYQMDYREMLERHIKSKADLTVATIPVTEKEATGFGIMKTNSRKRIESFVEKPGAEDLEKWASDTGSPFSDQGKHYLASMGIYIFNKKKLQELFDTHPEATDFGKEIIPSAIDKGTKVYSYEFGGYWTDIGTIRSFYDANLALTKTLPEFNLFDNENFIYTRARLLPASKLMGTMLDSTVLAEACIVEASRIANSLIGIRSRIGKGSTIEDCIVMGNDYFPSDSELHNRTDEQPVIGIGDRCYLSHTIVDKNCKIGNDVRIVGGPHLDDGKYERHYVVDGIVIIPKGMTVPAGYSV
ncbi:MAG: glucose-1-phosphate adenylyltransferase [Balneolaceae bacterium]